MTISGKDFWTGLIYIFFGSSAILIARGYGMGTAIKMGPAYLPSILGGLLILIGIISLIRSILKKQTPITRITIKGLVLVVFSTILFGFLVRGAGLIVALPILVLVSASASKDFRWIPSILMAVGLTLFCTFVFLKGLGIPLPILGSWFGG
ncbi:MAG: tripartite tricarboxylate transporter TctB family protein [Deltaproteobacteria bacterium]|nr:tripartite tricarboxylate transporter TctB family protein [Deltaproteobacteria bacterium]